MSTNTPFRGFVVCQVKLYKRWGKVQQNPGSPKAAYRSSLQTTLRCCGGNALVLSGKEKASTTCQVSIVKMNASEPLTTHRNTIRPHQNQCFPSTLGQAERTPVVLALRCAVLRWHEHEGGSCRELGKLRSRAGLVCVEAPQWRTDP